MIRENTTRKQTVCRLRLSAGITAAWLCCAAGQVHGTTNLYIYASATIYRSERPVIAYNCGLVTNTVERHKTDQTESFAVWNCGGGLLEYTLSAETFNGADGWLQVAQGPHSHQADDPANQHSITLDAAELAEGVYSGRVVIAAQDAVYAERELSVELSVVPYEIPAEWILMYYDSVDAAPPYSVRGWPLLWEYIAGTDPTDPASQFSLNIGEAQTSDRIKLFVDSLSNRLYSIDARTNLQHGQWITIITNYPGDGSVLLFEDLVDQPGKFYRIRVKLDE